jgi:RNA polymerase sigma factor (sigma-70 family)
VSPIVPFRGPKSEDELVVGALPWATKLARVICRVWRVRSPAIVKDAEQTACQVVVEKRPDYDDTRGSFEAYLWKPVVGAVRRHLQREVFRGRTGFDDALEESDEVRDTRPLDDPFAADDITDEALLKKWSCVLTFRRMMGDTRVAVQAQPENEALRAQVFRALNAALGGLEARHMRLLDLRYWQELTWKEVGDAMHLSDRQAKRIDEEIRERLQGDLRRRGIDEVPPSLSP